MFVGGARGTASNSPGQPSAVADRYTPGTRERVTAPEVNLSTIYRNLDELERLHVIDRTHIRPWPRDLSPGRERAQPPALREVRLAD